MHKKSVGIAMLLGLTMAVPAQAEMWSCEYDGSWSTFNSNDKGQFILNTTKKIYYVIGAIPIFCKAFKINFLEVKEAKNSFDFD